jgi:excisionase family DNA binding protein
MSRVQTPTETMARAFVALRGVDVNSRDALSAAVEDAAAELEAGLADRSTYSKAEAAHLLDVSTTTLEKWVVQGRLPVVRVPQYKRDRVPARPLLRLAGEVRELRRLGRRRGLLVEALSRLEQQDPQWQREFDDLYGEGLRAMRRGDLVKVDLDSFGPDD